MNAMFIDVQVDAAVAADTALAKKLTEVCPVNIFAQEKDGCGSSRRTWMNACSASCASRPHPRAACG